ncbi:MAG: DUF5715 family protein [Bacteroidales bacterium]|nr:DUF5715 family protein [Bacteroidales bacterium]
MKGLGYRQAKIACWAVVALVVMALLGIMAFSIMDRSEEDKSPETVPVKSQSITPLTRTERSVELAETPPSAGVVNDSVPVVRQKLYYKPVANVVRLFNDSNYVHLAEAERVGIKPIESLRDAWRLRRPVVYIESNKDFVVDTLTHSVPYLVPEAAQLLHDIGRTFNDSLQARGGGDYRIKVTSVLRTPDTIKKLRRRNRNAVDTSAHQFGTTFDISYLKFIEDSQRVPRTDSDLRGLLTEILADLHAQGRCYVKFERKQACFHITVRGRKE